MELFIIIIIVEIEINIEVEVGWEYFMKMVELMIFMVTLL